MEKERVLAAWTCPCGNHNAPSFQFCPTCAKPQAEGEPICIDDPDSVTAGSMSDSPSANFRPKKVVIEIPADLTQLGDIRDKVTAKGQALLDKSSPAVHEARKRCQPVAARVVRGAKWAANLWRQEPSLRILVTFVFIFVGVPAWIYADVPNPLSAGAAIRKKIRESFLTDLDVRLAKKLEIVRIANITGQPFIGEGEVFYGTREAGYSAVTYRAAAYWEGFPCRYRVDYEKGVGRPVTPEEMEQSASGVRAKRAIALSAPLTAPTTDGRVFAQMEPVELKEPDASDQLIEEENDPRRTGWLEDGQEFEDWIRQRYTGAKSYVWSQGSGGRSFFVTTANGSKFDVSFVLDRRKDKWAIYVEPWGQDRLSPASVETGE